jgi:hypothetical protein
MTLPRATPTNAKMTGGTVTAAAAIGSMLGAATQNPMMLPVRAPKYAEAQGAPEK